MIPGLKEFTDNDSVALFLSVTSGNTCKLSVFTFNKASLDCRA